MECYCKGQWWLRGKQVCLSIYQLWVRFLGKEHTGWGFGHYFTFTLSGSCMHFHLYMSCPRTQPAAAPDLTSVIPSNVDKVSCPRTQPAAAPDETATQDHSIPGSKALPTELTGPTMVIVYNVAPRGWDHTDSSGTCPILTSFPRKGVALPCFRLSYHGFRALATITNFSPRQDHLVPILWYWSSKNKSQLWLRSFSTPIYFKLVWWLGMHKAQRLILA